MAEKRENKSKGIESQVHIISTWANENNLVLGQIRVNEITAIQELIENLMIEDFIVTIDIMETQTYIVEKIIDNVALEH